MMSEHQLLFYDGDLGRTLDGLESKARQAIGQLQPSRLHADGEHKLFADLERQFIVLPLRLHREQMSLEGPREVENELSGTRAPVKGMEVKFIVPFEGDALLFQCRPSTYSTRFPEGKIVGQEYRLTVLDFEKKSRACEART